jgi:thiol:disulfide interchange protein
MRMNKGMVTLALAGLLMAGGSTPASAQRLYQPTADADKDIAAAVAMAASQKKLVLIEFGGDWCVDCWVLDTLMHEKTVEPIVRESFLVVKVDVGSFDRNLHITKRYGDPISAGVPAVVILDGKGVMIASTKEKPWENARGMKAEDVRRQLEIWAAKKPKSH